MIRPQPCRWFEIVVAREDAYGALEALAAAGCVEVEWHPDDASTAAPPAALLKTHAALARRFATYWPPPMASAAPQRAPAVTLESAVARLQHWSAEADAMIAPLQRAQAEDAELALAADALGALRESRIDFAALARADGGVKTALFALPPGSDVELPRDVIVRQASLATTRLLLAVGTSAALDALGRAVAEVNGRRAPLPSWLQPGAADSLAHVAQRRAALGTEITALRAAVDALNEQHGVATALGDVARALWCYEHGGAIDRGDVFARISGWTTDREQVVSALESCNARAIARFPKPPPGVHPPLVLRNPWWAQPFELFTRLMGMPGQAGADPSVLLALSVPLIFGYMFGDVGQGIVLAVAGWLLRRRLPVLRLLIPGGIAAALFGFVFGAVFTLEHVVGPWWVHPIEHPLPVLLVPIVAGAALMGVGLLIGGLEAWWDRRLAVWLRDDAAVLLAYAGALGAFLSARSWWLVAAAVVWAVAAAVIDRRRIGAAFAALGQLLEHTVQVLINTLSFARVGAFALAHAGLSSAVVALANAAGNRVGFVLVLIVGNALIIVVEGLVVSIQTTRLVLFEFFTRFFNPEGREFRPLAAPPLAPSLPITPS